MRSSSFVNSIRLNCADMKKQIFYASAASLASIALMFMPLAAAEAQYDANNYYNPYDNYGYQISYPQTYIQPQVPSYSNNYGYTYNGNSSYNYYMQQPAYYYQPQQMYTNYTYMPYTYYRCPTTYQTYYY